MKQFRGWWRRGWHWFFTVRACFRVAKWEFREECDMLYFLMLRRHVVNGQTQWEFGYHGATPLKASDDFLVQGMLNAAAEYLRGRLRMSGQEMLIDQVFEP